MRTAKSLTTLTAAGALCGLVAAGAALAFRWLVEEGQRLFLPGAQVGNYEALPWWAVLALPTVGGVVLGLAMQRLPVTWRQVGIVHVVVQLHHTERPRFPLPNAVVQFVAGAGALICGQSVDREGPSVHLGAALGNWIGRWVFRGPGVYALTACGAAAAIAAAFNTPLAGVLFVVEVLRIDYRLDRFMPVITAAVVGALLGRLWFGNAALLSLPAMAPTSVLQVPGLVILGAVIGLLAVAFVSLTKRVAAATSAWRPDVSLPIAGLTTGVIGLVVPQVLGVSYDTLATILAEGLATDILLGVLLGKLVATAVSIALRVPGGLIGPSLIIGGAAGAALGSLGPEWLGLAPAAAGFYATIGMVAMLSAVLQAPMSSLLALLELTGEPAIILPGMLTIVVADLISRRLLGRGSLFEYLRKLGRPGGIG